MLFAIRAFTSWNSLRQFFYWEKGFRLKKIDHYKYRHSFQGDSLEFSKFYDVISCSSKIKNLVIKCQLLSASLRQGCYHYQSLRFLPIVGGSVLTGYVNDSTGKFRVIHSVIINGDTVFDYTNNLVTSRKNYDQLLSFSILSEISKETMERI